jgi:sulfur carrier protein
MPSTATPTSNAVEVFVNDARHVVAAGTTLLRLLEDLALGARPGVAVAVNAAVVARAEWSARALQPGDSVLVIHASQGG